MAVTRRARWTMPLALPVACALALALAACGGQPARTDAPAVTVTAAAGDPALRGALRDAIMVDPALVQQANADSVRPPAQPASGAVPPDDIATRAAPAERELLRPAPRPFSGPCPLCDATRRALAAGVAAQRRGVTGNCPATIAYSAAWANRLPAAVPLYPDARVREAAGADGAGCALRVVSFASAAPPRRILDWYFTRTGDAGYRPQLHLDGADQMLVGLLPGRGAFTVTVRARDGGGSDVDLTVDGGD